MAGPIKAWSYSTLTNFQKCPRRVYLDKVLKEPTLPLEPPPGKDEHPLIRGTRIHDAAEMYMKEDVELVEELIPFAENFENARLLAADPQFKIIVEDEWAFTKDWRITGWLSEDAYLRMKLDLLIIWAKLSEGLLVDYKTGRRHGNEITHMIQAQLYQLAAFIRYPELTHITVEFWYIDQREITRVVFTRDFGMRFLQQFDDKGLMITEEIEFNPTPSAWACKYCPFGHQYGTGVCAAAYK